MSPATRPNILLVMTDQHRPDHTGFGGNTVVQTPNLDALASTSVRFDRAFVANPICMPNRASIFTSRMPSLHGTRYNGSIVFTSDHGDMIGNHGMMCKSAMHYEGTEQFDLRDDPHEMINLTGPVALRVEMIERLAYALMATHDISPKLTAFA